MTGREGRHQVVYGACLIEGVNVYLKASVLPLPFVSNNICSLVRGKCGCRCERVGVHHNFSLICYLLGVNGIRGQNIYPTTFAPHVWYLRGKIRVNLLYLPLQPPPLGSLELPLCFRFFSILLLVLGT
jgi:hypothetical protein